MDKVLPPCGLDVGPQLNTEGSCAQEKDEWYTKDALNRKHTGTCTVQMAVNILGMAHA